MKTSQSQPDDKKCCRGVTQRDPKTLKKFCVDCLRDYQAPDNSKEECKACLEPCDFDDIDGCQHDHTCQDTKQEEECQHDWCKLGITQSVCHKCGAYKPPSPQVQGDCKNCFRTDKGMWLCEKHIIGSVSKVQDDWEDLELLSAKLHEIYQIESKRQGDCRHPDDYNALSENTKEYDRVLARFIKSLLAKAKETPMGIDDWKLHGEKYGYWKYFEEQIAQECYLQCIAVGCGETEYSEAIRTKFNLNPPQNA